MENALDNIYVVKNPGCRDSKGAEAVETTLDNIECVPLELNTPMCSLMLFPPTPPCRSEKPQQTLSNVFEEVEGEGNKATSLFGVRETRVPLFRPIQQDPIESTIHQCHNMVVATFELQILEFRESVPRPSLHQVLLKVIFAEANPMSPGPKTWYTLLLSQRSHMGSSAEP